MFFFKSLINKIPDYLLLVIKIINSLRKLVINSILIQNIQNLILFYNIWYCNKLIIIQ